MRFLVVLILFGVTIAQPQRDERIVGGSPALIQQYPFMVSLQLTWWEGFYNHFCGGSLITRTAVLSASRCIDLLPVEQIWRVRVGSSSLTTGGTMHRVAKLIVHPNFIRMRWTSDVAIIRLVIPATLSPSVQLARIAGPNYSLPDDLRVHIVGWGATELGEEAALISDTLFHTDVRVVNQRICSERYSELRAQGLIFANVTESMLCTGLLDVGGREASELDIGGPVVHGGDIVVGVISWHHSSAHPRYPGVNTRVPSFVNWIVDNTVP